MIKVAQLYKLAEMEAPVKSRTCGKIGTDGVNIYRYGRCDKNVNSIVIYGFSAESGFKKCFMTHEYAIEAPNPIICFYYSKRVNKLYVIMYFENDFGMNIVLTCDGVICHKLELDKFGDNVLFQCGRDHDYYNNIVVITIHHEMLREYYVNDLTNTIQNKHYSFDSFRAIMVFSAKDCIYCISHREIKVIDRLTGNSKVIASDADDEIITACLSGDKKYLFATRGRTTAIYQISSFDQIPQPSRFKILGSVDGFIITHRHGPGMSDVIYRRGRPYAMVCDGKNGDLRICAAGSGVLISLSPQDREGKSYFSLYNFTWNWHNFKLQDRRVQREAVYVYMILRSLGFDHNMRLLISTMVMTA